MKKLTLLVVTVLSFTTLVSAQWSSGRPDGHAPINVMGDHTHKKGEIMFSYRFMWMNMDGNGDGTDEVSNSGLLRPNGGAYMVAPVTMPMQMHMLGAMYAVTDDLTLMLMLPYQSMEMDHITAMGGEFVTESSGLGDIKLSGMYNIYAGGRSKSHVQLGVSFPTGTIDNKDENPMSDGEDVTLPYPMQIGSGTFDLLPAITYLAQTDQFSFGSQLKGVIRLGENDQDYTFGDRLSFVNWIGYKLSDIFSPQLSLNLSTWGDISGESPDLAMANSDVVVHTVDPDLKAGTRLDLGIGLNIQGPGDLHDLRFGAMYELPVYQNLDGPQMWNAGILTLGLQYALD
ncbi:MAG: transporter [Balneola sp.]|nr:MAG: transporter [Balneola sp.]